MASSEDPAVAASATARERGNGFYKSGDFNNALNAYKEAASLAPEDPAPLSNMSAVRFEMGRYTNAVAYAEQALQLLRSEPDDSPKRQKLHARIVKSLLYSLDFGKAELAKTAIARLGGSYSAEGITTEALRTTATETQALWTSVPRKPDLRAQVLDRLPRYKAHLLDCPEYYGVGHDVPRTIIDGSELQALPASQHDLTFLFCGSGDARHIFMTLFDFFKMPLVTKTGRFSSIHFTVLDLKPAAVARMTIIIDMLSRYSIMKYLKTPGHADALIVASYVYTCQIVPPFVFEKLQEHLDNLIEGLEGGEEDPFPYLYIPPSSLHQITRVFRQWKESLGSYYAVPRTRVLVRDGVKMNRQQRDTYFGARKAKMTEEWKDFDALGVVFADSDFIKRREPRLGELYAAYKSGGPAQLKEIEQYLDTTWKVNVTLLDSDHEATRNENLADVSRYYESGCQAWRLNYGEFPANLTEFDPVEMADMFVHRREETSYSAIEKMAVFFDVVALSIITLNKKLTIEALVGEMADVMERIRHDALGHRSLAPRNNGDSDPRKFPRTFDRIHMSNIPDYVGGLLTVFLSARPLLREQKQANMRFNNLLNPPMFDSHENFQAEYLLMVDDKRIAEHFAVVRERSPELPSYLQDMMPFPSFVHENYFTWSTVPERPLPWSKWMRRQEFETWVYGHLLKLCLPYPRPPWSDRPVHAPLNLTALFRLLERMSEVGYPAHWMAGVLASACTGEIVTGARAPGGVVVHQDDLGAAAAMRKVSVAPWRAELTTLLSIWRRLLPFGVITPKGALVPLSEVVEYQVRFPPFRQEQMRVPHFTLVFWDTQRGRPPLSMWVLLSSDKKGAAPEPAGEVRDRGVHVVTTFRFVTYTRTASFWMRRDVVEAMRAGAWEVYVWRTDNWRAATEAVDVSSNLEEKRTWLDADIA